MKKIAPFYLQSFTPEGLAEIRAFYESPTGLVLMEQTPELMLQGAIVGGERISNTYRTSKCYINSTIIERVQHV